MPSTAHGYPYPTPADPVSLGAANIQALADAIEKRLAVISSNPPTAPVDGQLWYFPVALAQVWVFRYNAGSSSAYKWELVGGAPVSSQLVSPQLPMASTAYNYGSGSPATPVVNVPFPGDYLFDYSSFCYGDTTALRGAYMTPNGGNLIAQDAHAIQWNVSTQQAGTGSRSIVQNGCLGPFACSLAYRTVSGTVYFVGPFLSVLAIRVGPAGAAQRPGDPEQPPATPAPPPDFPIAPTGPTD